MKKLPFVLLLTALAGASCGSTHSIIEKFSKKTPHEKYEEVLDDRDIDESPEGRAWVAASKSALENAQDIQLPYRQLGFFQQGKPRALGLRFHAKQGQRITFTLDRTTKGMVIYSDVFQSAKSTPSHLHFGVYTFGGAVDPFPFVNKNVQEVPSVPHKDLSGLLKVIKTYKGSSISVHANSVVPLAATPAGYLAELPDGKLVQLPFNTVKKIENSGAVAMK